MKIYFKKQAQVDIGYEVVEGVLLVNCLLYTIY